MTIVNISNEAANKISENFTRINGLIGIVRNTNNQIYGCLTAGKINGVIYIGVTAFDKPCYNKQEIKMLKLLGMDRINSISRKKNVINYVERNGVATIHNDKDLHGDYLIDSSAFWRNDINTTTEQEIRNKCDHFIKRIRNYYTDDVYSYVVLEYQEIEKNGYYR